MANMLWKTAGASVEAAGRLLLGGIRGFISPEQPVCSLCRQLPPSAGLNPLGLCSLCARDIPWIREIRCPVCGRPDPCPDCVRRTDPPLRLNRSAVRYDARMKDLLALYKYRGDERLKELLGRMLVQAYRLTPPEAQPDVLTYVPLSRDRFEERGFNQAEQTALVLGRLVKRPVLPLLRRLRVTHKMSLQSRQERLRALEGVFEADPEGLVQLAALKLGAPRRLRIAIVDDVYTTGSTMNQCAAALRAGLPDADIFGLCWAR